MSKALGLDIRYESIPPDAYRKLGFPGADDLGNMFQFYMDFELYFCEIRDVAATRALNPELMSFGDWMEKNKNRMPL
jgi:hypothetical protein